VTGKVGKDVSVEEGYDAARLVGLNLCATLKHNLGDLDKVKRVVKLTGFVNCIDGFGQQPAVINGCSDLFLKIFEDKGAHTRSAVGTNALPLNVAVEIEAIFEV
jgi:enamine deaminase RidA (YjgF/YER057c/UK114 family)